MGLSTCTQNIQWQIPVLNIRFPQQQFIAVRRLTLDIRARNVSDLMGWQFDIVFDRAALEAVDVIEGDFLKTGAATFFQSGSIDNSRGQITGLTAVRLSTQGVSGTGPPGEGAV